METESTRRPGRLGQVVRAQLGEMKGSALLAALCTLGMTVTDLLRPWPLKVIFDHILLDRPLPGSLAFLDQVVQGGKTSAVVVVSLIFVLIFLVRGAFSYWQINLVSRLGSQMVYALRKELFTHLQRLSIAFHTRSRSGELLTRVATDTALVRDVFTDSVLTIVAQALTIVGMFAVMFALSWQLALIVLASFPLLVAALLPLYRRARKSAKRQRSQEEKVVTQISQALATATLVQAFSRERYEAERFDTHSSGQLQESVRNARIDAVTARAVEITTALGTWAVVLFGSLQVLDGAMSPGSVLVFTSYLSALYRPVRTLAKLSTRLTKATVSAQRIAEILDTEPDVQDRPDAIEAPALQGEVVFDRVTFHYGDGKPVLQDVSFTVRPGQRVALVGPSGAGKSTIVSLILRLYDPQEGAILLDGVDLRSFRRESFRRQIGTVLQESTLFGATIKENIAYGKLDATMDEIVAAARGANAHDFVVQLEHGYDTIIGERGETLSGGQRRRIAIARALIRRAPILILDEPMTGLDVESEAKVRQALERLMAGKTCLLITHDLQAAAEVDQIVVIDQGRALDSGRHEELLARSQTYRQAHALELGRQAYGDGAASRPSRRWGVEGERAG